MCRLFGWIHGRGLSWRHQRVRHQPVRRQRQLLQYNRYLQVRLLPRLHAVQRHSLRRCVILKTHLLLVVVVAVALIALSSSVYDLYIEDRIT